MTWGCDVIAAEPHATLNGAFTALSWRIMNLTEPHGKCMAPSHNLLATHGNSIGSCYEKHHEFGHETVMVVGFTNVRDVTYCSWKRHGGAMRSPLEILRPHQAA